MTIPKRITIKVTEADIERAHRNDSYKCVVAQAIARTVSGATNIDVDTQAIRFTVDGERRVYMTPYAVQGYVIAFDAGDPIEAFSFQLRDPVKVKRQVKTEAGKIAARAAENARHATRKARLEPLASGSIAIPDEANEAAKAAYAEARKAHPGATNQLAAPGRAAPPRVWKKKRRAYGHRLLRINREEGSIE
jgi:hypothetical protein